MKRLGQAAFSLLEVLIAFAIIAVVAMATYIAQSSSIFSSVRTGNVAVATNIARGFMAQSEQALEKLEFSVLKDKEAGVFPEPYAKFRWVREVVEVDFTPLTDVVGAVMQSSGVAADQANSEAQMMVVRIFQSYLKDSVRKMTLTVEWTEDGKNTSLSFTTFLVRYDAEFKPTL